MISYKKLPLDRRVASFMSETSLHLTVICFGVFFCQIQTCETAGRAQCAARYVRGRASVNAAVARPTVHELRDATLTAYQSLAFQPRTPRWTSAVTNDATWDFHLNATAPKPLLV